MICRKCGAEVADELTFCTVCGEAMQEEKPEKKRLFGADKKKLLMIGGGIVAVIVVIALAIILFGGNDAEDRVEEIYEAAVDYDINSVLEALPPKVLSYYKDQLDLGDTKLEILDSKELRKSRVKELDERYQETYGTKPGYVEAVCEVEILLSYDKEEISRDPIKIYLVEVDGNWYLDLLLTIEELEEAEVDPDKLPMLPSFP